MSKKLTNDDDVQQSNESFENEGGRILKIPEGKTPVYLLSDDYADGYVHWVNLPDGTRTHLICAGGLEGKGWAVDSCPVCGRVASLYKMAKAIEGKDKERADVIRKRAGSMRAKYEAHFLAAKGEMVKEKRGDKKVSVPDFEEGVVGILSMTKQQFESFTGLRSDPNYPFMKGPADLVNRVFVLDKEKREGSTFATTIFHPSKNQSDAPDVEYEADDFDDLEADFEIDTDALADAAELLAATEDEDFDTTGDDSSARSSRSGKSGKHGKPVATNDVADDFLDDEGTDETGDEGEEASDEAFVDDFEDDIPPTPAPKKGSKPTTTAKGGRTSGKKK